MTKLPCALIISCWWITAEASIYPVSDYDSFNRAQQMAKKGDSLVWQNGTYQNTVLDLVKNGYTFCAEEPGKVIFTGQSHMTIFGDSLTFSGFQFKNGHTEDDILKIAGSHVLIEQLNFSNFSSHYYLNILPGAQYNQVRYCNFERKPEDRTTSVFQIQADPNLPGYHRVSYCSFKDFTAPPGAGGDYGIEALRIGYSFQSTFIGRNVVEYCYFTKCKGDGEIISSKARENLYRYNTFSNNDESHFTLRHGSDNVVYGNFFLGGAGVRIKEGQNQMVYNNYFQTGDWFSINLMNHPADPLNNIIISHNSFAGSGPILGGASGNHPPKGVALHNNLFIDPTAKIMEEPTGDEHYYGNVTNAGWSMGKNDFMVTKMDFSIDEEGFYQLEKIEKPNSADAAFPALLDIPILDDDPLVQLDIMQQNREGSYVPGCLMPNQDIILQPYVHAGNTGPAYLQ